jgi:alpha-ketoglutarate-dependent taurine dioxygenase
MRFEPLNPNIGTRVEIDRTALRDAEVVTRLRDLLEERCVLVFPRIALSEEEQLAFTDLLGKRANYWGDVHGKTKGAADVEKLTLDPALNQRQEVVQASFFWHMDGLTTATPIPTATLLSARQLSEKGGQTDFANTFAAYENLPDDDKAEIADLRAVHSPAAGLRAIFSTAEELGAATWSKQYASQERPLVLTHPSGRKSLVIGSSADYVAGMLMAEGRALLSRLVEWSIQPAFTYRHIWQIGDLVIWNTRATLHRVIPYDAASGRLMHRTVAV